MSRTLDQLLSESEEEEETVLNDSHRLQQLLSCHVEHDPSIEYGDLEWADSSADDVFYINEYARYDKIHTRLHGFET